MRGSLRAHLLELLLDPGLNFAPSVPEVSPDAETWWPFPAVPPLIERGDRHSEIVGELLDSEESVHVFHTVDHGSHPVEPLSCIAIAGLKGFSKGFSTLC